MYKDELKLFDSVVFLFCIYSTSVRYVDSRAASHFA